MLVKWGSGGADVKWNKHVYILYEYECACVRVCIICAEDEGAGYGVRVAAWWASGRGWWEGLASG